MISFFKTFVYIYGGRNSKKTMTKKHDNFFMISRKPNQLNLKYPKSIFISKKSLRMKIYFRFKASG
jgi:hypothetical protein